MYLSSWCCYESKKRMIKTWMCSFGDELIIWVFYVLIHSNYCRRKVLYWKTLLLKEQNCHSKERTNFFEARLPPQYLFGFWTCCVKVGAPLHAKHRPKSETSLKTRIRSGFGSLWFWYTEFLKFLSEDSFTGYYRIR